MGIYLNPGNDSFERALNSRIYVDKSELIACTNDVLGSEQCNLCVSRPRRFGQSMAANMLAAYYSRGCESGELFQSLKVSKNPSYQMHLNQHDVIYMNVQQFLRSAKEPENLVNCMEQKVVDEIREIYGSCFGQEVRSLPDALTAVFSKAIQPTKGFIFIIDEWDCVFREARDHVEAQKAYLNFLRDLLKDRSYVQLAYMTGILPIKKYGTHSALNIFQEYSMTNADVLAEYMGFTESEVKNLCERFEKPFDEVQKWYDGYQLADDLHIYNPKSVIDGMLSRRLKSFWTGTETYEALQIYIDLDYDGLKSEIISMLGGGICKTDVGSFQNDMTTFKSRDDVFTLLVHLGYLGYHEMEQTVFIPNEEVRLEFIRALKNGKRPELVKAILTSDQLLEATLTMDEKKVAALIDEVHSATTTPLMYNDEESLRSVIKLAYYSSKDDYYAIQELPSGVGYADIVFLPRRGSEKPALVVELKWDKKAQGAIAQIKKQKYVQAIENYGGPVILAGICYDKNTKKHECVIETYQKE